MQEEIKYIGFYNLPTSSCKRAAALSATNKMDYICDSLNKAGYKVHLVSPSWFTDSSSLIIFQKRLEIKISQCKKLTLVPSFKTSKKYTEYLKIIYSLTWLFFWLIFNVKKGEKILVYHTPWLALPLVWAKKIKKFNIILEVEEIYGEVWSIKNILQQWEKKLIEAGDNYIVVSDVLGEMLPNKDKIILYGGYRLNRKLLPKITNNRIEVVYSGSIDKTKGGALNFVNCAEYLPNNYYLHILGYGDEKLISELKDLIKFKNQLASREMCVYHGVKFGSDYSDFLYSCDIGVNPQSEGDYMTTAFPSKIISYLTHNLPVVSTNIKSIEKSSLAKYIYFSENDSPEAIATSIISIDNSLKYDYTGVIDELDKKFIFELKNKFFIK